MTTRAAPPTEAPLTTTIVREVARRVVGQEAMVERLLVGLLTGGHILLEGVPGLAKTLAVRSLADAIHTPSHRIQFPPALLPADIIGTMIFDQRTGEFRPKRGPLFANIVLADEVNRAPAKVQAALLEAMQEKQVTIGGETHLLAEPFLVLATQNPIEQEGTYPLPEAQLDRFLLQIDVDYPDRDAERRMLIATTGLAEQPPRQAMSGDELMAAQRLVRRIPVGDSAVDAILALVAAGRHQQCGGRGRRPRPGAGRRRGRRPWTSRPRRSTPRSSDKASPAQGACRARRNFRRRCSGTACGSCSNHRSVRSARLWHPRSGARA